MPKQLRVLHVAPALYASRGGSVAAALGLCRALGRLGLDVEIVSTNLGEAGSWLPFHTETRVDAALGVPVAWQGARVRFFDVMPPSRFAMAQGIRSWLRSELPASDVVHIHCLHHFPGIVAARTAARHGIPYVVSPHGELAPYHRRRKRLRKLVFYRLFESRIWDHAAAIHFMTTNELDAAIPVRVQAPAVVVPAGVDLPEDDCEVPLGQFRKLHPDMRGRVIVTFLGRLTHQKGVDLLIPAFARVLKRFPDCHLVIAGPVEDEYGRAISRWVRDSGIESHVTMTGFIDGQEKEDLLADTDVWVLPSREENFGIAVVEAMARGLPVVISDNVALHSDIAAANAGVVVRLDVAELAEAMSALINDPIIRGVYGANGKVLARARFTWDSSAKQMLAVYEAIRIGARVGVRAAT